MPLFAKKSKKSTKANSRLACDFGNSKIVFLELSKQNDSTSAILTRFQKLSRPGTPEKDLQLLQETLSKSQFTAPRIRLSVKGQGIIIRFLQFPLMKLPELRSAISFEIDQYIPFKSNEVVWDIHILDENVAGPSGTLMNVLLVAVKKDDLEAMIQLFSKAGFQVEFVDVDALAIINSLEFFHPDEKNSVAAILDIGNSISTLSVVQNGKPRFIRDISYGGSDIQKKIKRKLGCTIEEAADKLQNPAARTPETIQVIKDTLLDMTSEIRVSMNYYLDQVVSAEPIKKLFVEGGGGYLDLLLETFQGHFGFPVQAIEPFQNISFSPDVDKDALMQNKNFLAVPFGLALRDS